MRQSDSKASASAASAGRRGSSRGGRWNWLACAALAALAGGCSNEAMIVLANEGEFENAIQSDRPVLVEFYKGGCPTCAALEPKLNKLAVEYQDCVTFARFELMKPYFVVTAPAIQDKYGIYFYPTVIVFVQGVEFQRWVMDQKVEDYRRGLDDVLGGAMPTTTPATTISATRPSTTAASRPPSVPATTRPSTTVAPVPAGTTAPTTAAARPSSPSSSQTSDGSR